MMGTLFLRLAGPSWVRTIALLACTVATALFACGCAETPPPAASLVQNPPPLHAVHLPGGPIVRTPAPAPPYNDPIAVRVTYYAADHMPDPSGGVTVGRKSRLVIRDRTDSPVRPSADLTRNAILFEHAGQLADTLATGPPSLAQPLGQVTGLLPRGVTFSTRLADPYRQFDATSASPTQRYVAIDVSRPAARPTAATRPATQALRIALTLADVSNGQPPIHQETAVLSTTAPDTGGPLALAVPFALTNTHARAIVAVIQLTPFGHRAPPPPALLARLDRDLHRKSAAAATSRPAGQFVLTNADAAASFVAGVLPGLLADDRRRTSLVFLADDVHAPVTRDLALSADDKTLASRADRILTKLTEPNATFDRNHVAWLLDSTSLALLSEQQSAHTLPKPLEAVLTPHTGEAARHQGSLDEVLQSAHSQADLATALANENIILLSDSSPSARVRAYDWLTNRGLAPDGYDPLDPPRKRQAALDQWMERRNAAAATQPTTRAAATTAARP